MMEQEMVSQESESSEDPVDGRTKQNQDTGKMLKQNLKQKMKMEQV